MRRSIEVPALRVATLVASLAGLVGLTGPVLAAPQAGARPSLPLLDDPQAVLHAVLGSAQTFSTGPADDRDPNLACGGGRYLLAWERAFSFDHMDVMGLLLDGQGRPIGAPFAIASSSSNVFQANPWVAWVECTQTFLVVWDRQDLGTLTEDVFCATVSPTGSVSPAVEVAPSASVQRNPCVGGNGGTLDDAGLVVWDETGVGLRARRMRALPGGPLPAAPAFSIAPDVFGLDAVRDPTLSGTADVGEPYLVVWTQPDLGPLGPGYDTIRARAVAVDGTLLGSGSLQLSDPALAHDAARPSCDGDGRDFVVAWEVDESAPSSGVHDLRARHVVHCAGALLPGPLQTIEGDVGDDEIDVRLAFLGKSTVALYRDQSGAAYDVRAKSLDPYNAFAASDETLVSAFPTPTLACAAASRNVGTEEAVLVWQQDAGLDAGDVVGARWSGPDGTTDLGGGCGQGGSHATPCAIGGNASFTLHLQGSTPFSRAVLVAGGLPSPITCGPCKLIPALESVFYATTDAKGDAAITVPLAPGLSGGSFVSQWATFVDVGACPLAPLDFSNALETKVQ